MKKTVLYYLKYDLICSYILTYFFYLHNLLPFNIFIDFKIAFPTENKFDNLGNDAERKKGIRKELCQCFDNFSTPE